MGLFALAVTCLLVAVAHAQANCSDFSNNCQGCLATAGCGFCWSSQLCLDGTAAAPTSGEICLPYTWTFGNASSCPDSPQGCAKQTTCGGCVRSNHACAWCGGTATTPAKCVVIDKPLGGSSQCGTPAMPGHTFRTCVACSVHASCVSCQGESQQCFWCPQEQMCLPQNSGQQCNGIASLPGNCRDCSLYSSSCDTCQQQPDCVFCLASNTCTAQADCSEAVNTCRDQCATVHTCQGCLKLQDCRWDAGTCSGRALGQPHQISCPIPSGFDAGSFVGGIFLILGLAALGVVIYLAHQYYQRTHGRHASSLVVQ